MFVLLKGEFASKLRRILQICLSRWVRFGCVYVCVCVNWQNSAEKGGEEIVFFVTWKVLGRVVSWELQGLAHVSVKFDCKVAVSVCVCARARGFFFLSLQDCLSPRLSVKDSLLHPMGAPADSLPSSYNHFSSFDEGAPSRVLRTTYLVSPAAPLLLGTILDVEVSASTASGSVSYFLPVWHLIFLVQGGGGSRRLKRIRWKVWATRCAVCIRVKFSAVNSRTLMKNAAKFWRNVRPSISREFGHKKFHKKFLHTSGPQIPHGWTQNSFTAILWELVGQTVQLLGRRVDEFLANPAKTRVDMGFSCVFPGFGYLP